MRYSLLYNSTVRSRLDEFNCSNLLLHSSSLVSEVWTLYGPLVSPLDGERSHSIPQCSSAGRRRTRRRPFSKHVTDVAIFSLLISTLWLTEKWTPRTTFILPRRRCITFGSFLSSGCNKGAFWDFSSSGSVAVRCKRAPNGFFFFFPRVIIAHPFAGVSTRKRYVTSTSTALTFFSAFTLAKANYFHVPS